MASRKGKYMASEYESCGFNIIEAVWIFFWLRLARYKLYLIGLLQFNIKIISYEHFL